jgi:hypothetical protein
MKMTIAASMKPRDSTVAHADPMAPPCGTKARLSARLMPFAAQVVAVPGTGRLSASRK